MAYASLAIAGISALSSFMGSAAQNRRARRLRKLASPEHLRAVISQLTPFYRELVSAGLGPMFIQESARALSEAGLSGTGVGEALRTVSKAVPTSIATGEATNAAQGVVNRELEAEGGSPAYNPLGEALAAGARGFLATSQANRAAAENELGHMTLPQAPIEPFPQPGIAPPPTSIEPPLFPTSPAKQPVSTNPLDRPGVNI